MDEMDQVKQAVAVMTLYREMQDEVSRIGGDSLLPGFGYDQAVLLSASQVIAEDGMKAIGTEEGVEVVMVYTGILIGLRLADLAMRRA